jgi:predicted  nucleic acid-binding Zn-ribbon protein
MPRTPKAIARINRLYSQVLRLLERDIQAIEVLTQRGEKLAVAAAKDLRDYAKLLRDMKEAQEKLHAEKAAKAKEATTAVPDADLMKAVTGAGGAG